MRAKYSIHIYCVFKPKTNDKRKFTFIAVLVVIPAELPHNNDVGIVAKPNCILLSWGFCSMSRGKK